MPVRRGQSQGEEVGDLGRGQIRQGFVSCEEELGSYSRCDCGSLHVRTERRPARSLLPRTEAGEEEFYFPKLPSYGGTNSNRS